MTSGTQPEDEYIDAAAVQHGSCLTEAVLIVVLSALTFLLGLAWVLAEANGIL